MIPMCWKGSDGMQLRVLSPRRVVFEGEARSVQLAGDLAEFEILDYHAPIVSLLRPGNVVVDGVHRIPINRGMVKFNDNDCMILVEEASSHFQEIIQEDVVQGQS
jgi:F-type H+-transporting ATPase subunit epsilon